MIMSKEEFLKEYDDEKFRYMLLGRMMSDCDYYIANEMHCDPEYNHLWAHHDPKAQITYMRYLWESLKEKPEWLTKEQIDEYAKRMEVE